MVNNDELIEQLEKYYKIGYEASSDRTRRTIARKSKLEEGTIKLVQKSTGNSPNIYEHTKEPVNGTHKDAMRILCRYPRTI